MTTTSEGTTGLPASGRHTITHLRAPLRWEEGLPLGNGQFGVMLWGDGGPLKLTLDHANLWDLRYNEAFKAHPDYNYAGLRRLVAEGAYTTVDEVFEGGEMRDNPVSPTKISLGRAELHIAPADECRMALDIDQAVIRGELQNGEGRCQFTAFVHHEHDLLCLHTEGAEAAGLQLSLIPLAKMTPQMAELGHPEPVSLCEDGVQVVVQELAEGPSCAIAWSISASDLFLAVGIAPGRDAAIEKAAQSVREAVAAGFDALEHEHIAAWASFWAGSAVFLPERRMELLWYYGVYLLASSAREGSCPPGLQGAWAMDGVMPPWRGDYHADMNVQETFWPACCSGHLELLDTWCDPMRRALPRAQEFTRGFFGTEGAFWPCCTVPEMTTVPCWHTVQFAWSSVGWLSWLVWLRWRYSMDRSWLRETGYPIIAEVVRFYRANVEPGEDGRLHIPLSSSPEYRENSPAAWCSDPAIDIALIRRCCAWVLEMEEALGVEELSAVAEDLRARLVPYPLTDDGVLCLWPGKPLDESHRHPSQLMAIHPAMDLTIEDDDEARRIIDASIEQYLSLGQYRWAGHTYAQLISMAAVTGRAGWAYDCLRHFAEHWIGPNGLHFNADLALSGMSCYRYAPGAYGPFTMEANCAVAAGIGDMLVQGWGDRVRVFPAVPEVWPDIAFRDLLTEGAFRVSALRRNGATQWVQITATVDRKLRLKDPFAGQQIDVSGAAIERVGDDLVADLKAGDVLTFSLPGMECTISELGGFVRESDSESLGLRG